jgi:hypothetical protein
MKPLASYLLLILEFSKQKLVFQLRKYFLSVPRFEPRSLARTTDTLAKFATPPPPHIDNSDSHCNKQTALYFKGLIDFFTQVYLQFN